MKGRGRALIVFCVLFCFGVFACRYSVRDTGFVDLGDAQYELVLSGNVSDEQVNTFRAVTSASLLNANITFTTRDRTEQGDPVLRLEDAEGRKLLLSSGTEFPSTTEEISGLVESVALSPLRASIHESTLNTFAVVVLFEGADPEDNLRAKSRIQAAIRNIARIMPTMPKPVDTPPVLISVPREQAAIERVTLWGLGMDPVLRDEPRVAIVMGRGRRVGDPVEGPLLTQTMVQDRLAIIGQDCECELDREWMKGPMLPARWDSDRQRQAVQLLGFDPENPMVRAEVSRIVLRGPGERQVQKLAGGSSVLGYSEVMLDDLPIEEDVAVVEVAETTQIEADVVESTPEIPTEPSTPTSQAVVNPVESNWSVGWSVAIGAGVLLIAGAGLWWRKIRRDLG